MPIINYGDIVEDNGKTIRENNRDTPRRFKLGDIVMLGKERTTLHVVDNGTEIRHVYGAETTLYVVDVGEDCDGTPLYCLGSKPIKYPTARFPKEYLTYEKFVDVLRNIGEDYLVYIGPTHKVFDNIYEYMGRE